MQDNVLLHVHQLVSSDKYPTEHAAVGNVYILVAPALIPQRV